MLNMWLWMLMSIKRYYLAVRKFRLYLSMHKGSQLCWQVPLMACLFNFLHYDYFFIMMEETSKGRAWIPKGLRCFRSTSWKLGEKEEILHDWTWTASNLHPCLNAYYTWDTNKTLKKFCSNKNKQVIIVAMQWSP